MELDITWAEEVRQWVPICALEVFGQRSHRARTSHTLRARAPTRTSLHRTESQAMPSSRIQTWRKINSHVFIKRAERWLVKFLLRLH